MVRKRQDTQSGESTIIEKYKKQSAYKKLKIIKDALKDVRSYRLTLIWSIYEVQKEKPGFCAEKTCKKPLSES